MSSAFAEWRVRRERKLEADRARRRRIAKMQKKIKPPPPPEPEKVLRICRTRLKLREACELSSGELCDVQAGTRLRVLERRPLADGSVRALVALADAASTSTSAIIGGRLPSAPAGWVTAEGADGRSTLLEVTRTHRPCAAILSFLEQQTSDEERGVEEAWAYHLSTEQFKVMRMRGTDDAHTGHYTQHFAPGTYCCAACGHTLYRAEHKFASGCGWPSFSDNVDGALQRIEGRSVEITCAACASHVGHVYRLPSHPGPRHERHCANSTSLRFVAAPPSVEPAHARLDARELSPNAAAAQADAVPTGLAIDDELLSA